MTIEHSESPLPSSPLRAGYVTAFASQGRCRHVGSLGGYHPHPARPGQLLTTRDDVRALAMLTAFQPYCIVRDVATIPLI